MPDLLLRDALPADAPDLARLVTAAYLGQWTTTAAQVRQRTETAGVGRFTLVARRSETVVAGLNADPFSTAPGGLRVQLYGDPAAFTPLYLGALTRASALGFRSLLSVVRQDHRPQVEFLGAAGWRNAYQSWGAHLDLSAFDLAPYRALEERHFLNGTEVRHFARDSSDAPWEALHALHQQGVQDTPRNPTTSSAPGDLAHFRREVACGPVFAALHNGEVLSYTALEISGSSVETTHTATRAAHRGQGLATLVKATALAWAQQQGYVTASTGGNVANLPMLRVNQRLGYIPEPMWLTWVQGVPTATSPA